MKNLSGNLYENTRSECMFLITGTLNIISLDPYHIQVRIPINPKRFEKSIV